MNQEQRTSSIDLPKAWALEFYNIKAEVHPLDSYEDLNFKLTDDQGNQFILKIAAEASSYANIAAQNQILMLLNESHQDQKNFPKVIQGLNGQDIQTIRIGGIDRYLRVLDYLEGSFLHEVKLTPPLLNNFGAFLGLMDIDLQNLRLESLEYQHSPWDLQYALDCARHTHHIVDAHYRRLARYFLQQYEVEVLPKYQDLPLGVIHGDANDHNVLVQGDQICGLIDFGDATYSHRIHELAVALPYIMMGQKDPLSLVAEVVKGYHLVYPLLEIEIELLYHLINARLAVSLTRSSLTVKDHPDNDYLAIHQQPVKDLMDQMLALNPAAFEVSLRGACKLSQQVPPCSEELVTQRYKHISTSVSISYQSPLHIQKGAMQYLYDMNGSTYLDGVNNICHVGHSNPQVIAAAHTQWTQLNTNTRYLYRQLNDYASQLCHLLPDPLSIVFFVNSGSEANDLALRLARTHTGNQDMLVLEGAYHGNTRATLEISPYKYNGPGGAGASAHIHEIPMPDTYRGKYRLDHQDPARAYVQEVSNTLATLQQSQTGVAGFIAESLLGCGGQIVMPAGFLSGAYRAVREVGGVCIADEVQVGFGRVGSHYWGFQSQNVIPDIVTMGKPMGNGHPLAAVVTTKEIAQSFETGMEYFNSFGGNPVSCEIGKTVLQIIEEEQLQKHAEVLGREILKEFRSLQKDFPIIGDVRGSGLFLGMELVKDPTTRAADAELASLVVEEMRTRGILLSTDGPLHNVIKLKPPLVFTKKNAVFLLDQLHSTFTKFATS